MAHLIRASVRRIVSLLCSIIRSKRLLSSAVIFIIAAAYFFRDCPVQLGPIDLKHTKHGHIKVTPEHFYSSDHKNPNGIRDTYERSVPPIVHFIWCHGHRFQYQNYLSILSAYKLLKPTEILVHYNVLPQRDPGGYYQYFDDLFRDLPNIFLQPIEDQRVCDVNSIKSLGIIAEMINSNGGIFVGINVLLSEGILKYLDYPFARYAPFSNFTLNGLLFVSPGGIRETKEISIPCSEGRSYSNNISVCAIVKQELFPYHIISLESDFGQLARNIGYGTSHVLEPQSSHTSIPNIVHYIVFSKTSLGFLDYMSLLSCVYIQKPDVVYIHGDKKPEGGHWNRIEHLEGFSNVKFIHREFPQSVFGNPIETPSQACDYLKIDILFRYGGIFVEWDNIWVRQLSGTQLRYPAIASLIKSEKGPFPYNVNLGIFGAQKGSKFLRFMMETFRQYSISDSGYNSMKIPYKVFEHHPDSIFLDEKMLGTCTEDTCRHRNRSGASDHSKEMRELPWGLESNALHLKNVGNDLFSEQTIFANEGLIPDVGKYLLLKEGDIKIETMNNAH